MTDVIRYQRRCFFASGPYSASFWGKYIYLYEGDGGLRLTSDSLSLEDCSQAVEIPFEAIKSVTLGRFSWTKPFGLNHLRVAYHHRGELRELNLIPFSGVMEPTWVTSQLVVSWLETLRGVEELTNRVETPTSFPEAPRSPYARAAVAGFVGAIAVTAIIHAVIAWMS
jgi:hypothetical protein